LFNCDSASRGATLDFPDCETLFHGKNAVCSACKRFLLFFGGIGFHGIFRPARPGFVSFFSAQERGYFGVPMETPATIRLKDALDLLDGPAPVAVRWVKCDRRRNTGGEFARLPAARIGRGQRKASALLRAPLPGEETDADRADVAADGRVPVPTGEPAAGPTPKDPAHWRNATRNLVDTRTGALVKIHIYLLVEVASRKVYI
jgi:hypothetical protein